MSTEGNRLSEPIRKCSDELLELISTLVPSDGANYLFDVVVFEKFEDHKHFFEEIINGYKFDYKVDLNDIKASSEEKQKSIEMEIEKFNAELDEKTRDFIVLMSFQRSIDTLLSGFLESAKAVKGKDEEKQEIDDKDENDGKNEKHKEKKYDYEPIIAFKGYKVCETELRFYNSICLLLDFHIYLFINQYPSTKNVFYSNLSQVSDILFNKSTESIDKFWYYLESRKPLIQEKIFDQNSIGDRISILEICNKLTDKFIFKTFQGKRDSYRKDTFNDTFQYRVRTFITSIFAFEDNTGLNKYFSTSNRIVNEVGPTSRYRNDADFIKDVIHLHKLFNDPYYYLKSSNHRSTQKTAETMRNVYQFLIEEELSWAKVSPKSDQFAVRKPRSTSEAKYLTEKYAEKIYFPENYWISPFDDSRKDSTYDELKQKDLEFYHSQFEISKFRQIYLLQIYIICSLFYELNTNNKKEFLKSLNAPTNVKHLTDDAPPDNLVNLFYKIKRELPKKFRDIDNQFSFLIQHIAITEMFWWGWLIYGKDSKTGKPLFFDKILTTSELKIVQDKSATVVPYKSKRYFNLYATPQLSRKMKVPTGLDRLVKPTADEINGYEDKIFCLNNKLETTDDPKEREKLVEERNVLTWKHLKKERSKKWLRFGTLLNTSMLIDDRSVSEDVPMSNKRQLEEDEESEDPTTKKIKA